MKTLQHQTEATMSFSLWALACRGIPDAKGLADPRAGQARMHPQSKGGVVLGLRSRRALSPAPHPEPALVLLDCH